MRPRRVDLVHEVVHADLVLGVRQVVVRVALDEHVDVGVVRRDVLHERRLGLVEWQTGGEHVPLELGEEEVALFVVPCVEDDEDVVARDAHQDERAHHVQESKV